MKVIFKIFLSISLVFFATSTFSKVTKKQVNLALKSASFSELKVFHSKIVDLYKLEDQQSKKSKKTSFLNFIIEEAYANAGERCYIGGWISITDGNGNCQAPWTSKRNQSFANSFAGHLYEGLSCSADGIPNSMRCNPLLFGNAANGKAKCVRENPFENVTQRCLEASSDLIDTHIQNIMEDEELRGQYSYLVRDILNHCSEDRNRSCHDLAGQISRMNLSSQSDNIVVAPDCPQNLEEALGLSQESLENFQDLVAFAQEPRPRPQGIWGPQNISNEEHCNVEGMTEEAKRNCQALLTSGDVPINALKFALEGMRRNATSFKTNGCYDGAAAAGDSPGFNGLFRNRHPSMAGMRKPEEFDNKMQNGIKNKCRLIINDAGDRIQDRPGRSRQMKMYVVDLCNSSGPQTRESWSWMGYGSCERGRTPAGGEYANSQGVGTTLLGFQVTNDVSFQFGSSSDAYRNLRSRAYSNFGRDPNNGNRVVVGNGLSTPPVPAVALFGLQSSNNRAMADYKYLHIGAYRSAGCPSLEPTEENYVLIEEMARSGPSVVVNYHEDKMEEYEKCESQEGGE